jgi:glycosyltransferase involved in cell wall biosynthesis
MSSVSTTTKPSYDSAMPRLRIAQIAPLYERIPPKLYGGTERTVSYIIEELVRRGHDVTLFAVGDAETSAKLHPACPQAVRLAGKQELGAFLQFPMLSDVYENADDFDVIHAHIDYWSFAFARLSKTPTVSTMHGRLAQLPELGLHQRKQIAALAGPAPLTETRELTRRRLY